MSTVFLAHPKSMTAETIWAYVHAAQPHLAVGTRVVTGRDDFEAAFRGSVKRWAYSISERYEGIMVVPVDGVSKIGSTTADIVEAALGRGRPVVVLKQDGSALPCVELRRTTGAARDGWCVETTVAPF